MASRYIGTRHVGEIATMPAANMPGAWQLDTRRVTRDTGIILDNSRREAVLPGEQMLPIPSRIRPGSPMSEPDQKRYSKSTP